MPLVGHGNPLIVRAREMLSIYLRQPLEFYAPVILRVRQQMATIFRPLNPNSLDEVRQWDVDFSPDMKTGVSVASAVATHIPPTGTATTPTVGTISANIVPVVVGPLAVLGLHYIDIVATLSDGNKSEARIELAVLF